MYASTVDGWMCVEAEVANEGAAGVAPLSLSALDLTKVVLKLQREKRVRSLVLEGELDNERTAKDLATVVRAVQSNGVFVTVRLPGDVMPLWCSGVLGAQNIEAYVRSGPWLQYACAKIVYELDEERKPEVADAHIQRRTPLFVLAEKAKEVEEAWKFVLSDPRPWRLLVEPKWRVKQDLVKIAQMMAEQEAQE